MNNPVDISRMYGLNNTATHTINSQNMHHKMQKLPPRATEEMNINMQMHNDTMNEADGMLYEPCNMNKEKHMYSQMQGNTQLMTTNSGMMTHSSMPNILLQTPAHTLNMEYMNDLLRTQVGKMADIEFLVGTNTTHLKRGQITGVGTNYIVIREFDTGRTMVGDFSNIKFVTIYDDLN
ncbi:MAG: hypothetical protein U0L18_04950 [Acutalibacteraceae bacterium]|nr:hypothetical protein [Acutalibacteraceae bacterium]